MTDDTSGCGVTTTLMLGDCLELLKTLGADSVDLLLTDPPYYRVKSEAWDRQWDTANGFIAWIGQLCEQFHRVLKPNGSLYVFASPRMAARVEMKIAERFNVLNRIRWVKDQGWHKKTDETTLRSWLSPWEEIVFAEHYGADNMAKGEAGYAAKCDELRGFIFEPLRAYLDNERIRACLSVQDVAEAWRVRTGNAERTGMAGHWFSEVQWMLPTSSNYTWLRETFCHINHGGKYLRREYEDLRREYEDLRKEYEDLRRPFSVTADVPYTDVWTFPTVQAYPGKHPCEKPQELLRHIITASSRPGAMVLDPFMGTCSAGLACRDLERNFIGMEISEEYFAIAEKRIAVAKLQLPLLGLVKEDEE